MNRHELEALYTLNNPATSQAIKMLLQLNYSASLKPFENSYKNCFSPTIQSDPDSQTVPHQAHST